jgi:hypothetical protein
MGTIVFGLITMVTAVTLAVQPVSAQSWQSKGSWCGPGGSTGSDCSFYSLEQCRASAGSGSCVFRDRPPTAGHREESYVGK